MPIVEVEPKPLVSREEARDMILNIQEQVSKLPGAKFGDSDLCPVKNIFAHGIYIREAFIPKGTIGVGRIHKHEHAVFVMKGDISVMSEDGVKRIRAPQSLISPPGTKRVGYAHEDTIWITVHANPENLVDTDEIINYLTVDDYAKLDTRTDVDLLEFISQIKEGK
jgi:quercetin dioxygenase-like cupin family protein